MRKLALALGALVFASSAFATPITFTASYTVNANTADPGLVIQTADVAPNPFSFHLDVGQWASFDLFKIWTNESAVNHEDDFEPKPINVTFNFTSPSVFDGSADGTTKGDGTVVKLFGHIIGVVGDAGILQWDAYSFDINFGSGGLLKVFLSNEKFNEGLIDLAEGKWYGEKVKAKFKLVSAPTSVPEPGTLALLGAGLLGLGVFRRRMA